MCVPPTERVGGLLALPPSGKLIQYVGRLPHWRHLRRRLYKNVCSPPTSLLLPGCPLVAPRSLLPFLRHDCLLVCLSMRRFVCLFVCLPDCVLCRKFNGQHQQQEQKSRMESNRIEWQMGAMHKKLAKPAKG